MGFPHCPHRATAWYDNGFHNVDFSITKFFKIKEISTLGFRAEFFNVFNWVNFVNPFGGPGGNGGSTNTINPSKAYGAGGLAFVGATPDEASSNPVLGSGGARDIQLGLKLILMLLHLRGITFKAGTKIPSASLKSRAKNGSPDSAIDKQIGDAKSRCL